MCIHYIYIHYLYINYIYYVYTLYIYTLFIYKLYILCIYTIYIYTLFIYKLYIYTIYIYIYIIFVIYPRAWRRGQHPAGPVVVDWDMDGEYELLLSVAGGFPMPLGFWNEILEGI